MVALQVCFSSKNRWSGDLEIFPSQFLEDFVFIILYMKKESGKDGRNNCSFIDSNAFI
jgi:hypothetical protein